MLIGQTLTANLARDGRTLPARIADHPVSGLQIEFPCGQVVIGTEERGLTEEQVAELMKEIENRSESRKSRLSRGGL